MAANLTNEKDNIDKVKFFMEECNRMGIKVMGPDVNESFSDFTPNRDGGIRFGLAGIKGVGEAAVENLVREREEQGVFNSIWDFSSRISQRGINRKTLESLAAAGAFDTFNNEGIHRANFFADGENNLIDKMVKFAGAKAAQTNTAQTSLFGSMGFSEEVAVPKIPVLEELPLMEVLKREYEVVGFYISGHPLDPFKRDINTFCTCTCAEVESAKGREIRFAGMITSRIQKIAKNGNPYCRFTIMDYSGQFEIALFGKDYLKFEQYGREGNFIFVRGEYRPRFGSQTEFMFNPMDMMLLSEVREKFMKGLELRLNMADIPKIDLQVLQDCLKRFQGKQSLRIKIRSEEDQMETEGVSRVFSVNPSEDFFQALKKELGLEVVLV
jgi:DNA polymerase-3 subunit alpha